jgi:hypothetical protein
VEAVFDLFDLEQCFAAQTTHVSLMPAILYTCPVTRDRVSSWVADDPEGRDDWLEAVECIACRRVHVIYSKSGKVFGGDAD